MLRRLWCDDEGLTTVEYALLLAVMALAAFAVGTLLAAQVSGNADSAAETVPNLR